MNNDNDKTIKKNLLIGCSGSIACVKLIELIERLNKQYNIRIILTSNSTFFVKRLIPDLEKFEKEKDLKFFNDNDEWTEWETNAKVLHIELRKWADIMLICPLSANTLAKISNGLCDNLLTCVVRAWDTNKPVFFALAMNTFMYEHFLTAEQKSLLVNKFKFIEIPTQIKKLACGDYGKLSNYIGNGALASVENIVKEIENYKK